MRRDSEARARRARGSRRRYDAGFKREVVEKTLQPGASVAAIALEHRLNSNLLFKWRRDHLRQLARLAPVPAPTMLPVVVESPTTEIVSTRSRVAASVIEIELPAGRIRLRGAVDVDSLRIVVDLLRR